MSAGIAPRPATHTSTARPQWSHPRTRTSSLTGLSFQSSLSTVPDFLMTRVASPGHKLGQTVGVLLQKVVGQPLQDFAASNELFCDTQGERIGVRRGRKVTWEDSRGNRHDLDYVLEKGGSQTQRGLPVAFIEIAWRRYTKHSRNKSGELEGALLPLVQTYPSARFLGVVLAGEYSEGGLQQLRSAGIEVLAIPFDTISQAFAKHGIKIDYPEKASARDKAALNRALESIESHTLEAISRAFWSSIKSGFHSFQASLAAAVNSSPNRVRVISLFGAEREFPSISAAILALTSGGEADAVEASTPQGYEVFIDFSTGSTISGRFKAKDELIRFLRRVG